MLATATLVASFAIGRADIFRHVLPTHSQLAHVAERHRRAGEAPRLVLIYFLLRFQNGGSSIVHLYIFVWVSLHTG